MLGYPPRYTKEQRKRKAYCDAFDAIYYYGMERKNWNYKSFNLCRREMKEIWAFAQSDVQGKSKYVTSYGR